MGVINQSKARVVKDSIYPAPYDREVAGRSSLRLGEAGGLTQFGVNIVVLEPGAKSSMRHWHHREDEFVMMTQGACTLVEDAGKTILHAGDCAAFPAGKADGHHLINHTDQEARFLVVGSKMNPERVTYSDVDLEVEIKDGRDSFTHKDGRPYQSPETGAKK